VEVKKKMPKTISITFEMGEDELADKIAKKLKKKLEDWKVEITHYTFTDETKSPKICETCKEIYEITVFIIEEQDFVKTTEILQSFAKL